MSPAPRPSPPDPLVGALVARCTFPPAGAAFRCGCSGGPDSAALVVLAVHAGLEVTAVHVDHGLRPGGAAEAARVEELCSRFGAGFESHRVAVAEGPNLEERARDARRRVLGPEAATGHTMDDQAETVLVNLMRGSGVTGLAGMSPGARHPMLALRRSDAAAICAAVGYEPVADPTNEERRFVRNRVRHELLPLLCGIAGRDLVPVLARQADLMRADAALLAELASLVDPTSAAELRGAPEPVARWSLRVWLAERSGRPPGSAEVARVLEVARLAARATELSGGDRVRRSGGRLSLLRYAAPVAEAEGERT